MAVIRYSRWDGSQEFGELDSDALLDQLSEDLMAHGDVWRALRRLMSDGRLRPHRPAGPSLQDMMRKLQSMRQQQLRRYDLSSVLDEYRRELDEIIGLERQALDERRGEIDRLRRSDPGDSAARTLERLVNRRSHQLDRLPGDVAGDLRQLSEEEFISPGAAERFQQLMRSLQQQVGQAMFRDMAQSLQNWGDAERGAMREMLHDLNEMLRARARGEEPDFQGFMAKHGHLFGENPPQTLDELLEQMYRQVAEMDAFLNSLPPEQRRELDRIVDGLLADEALRWEMSMLGQQLSQIWPERGMGDGYHFYGDEPLSMQEAMDLMGRLREVDELEHALQQAYRSGDFEGIDLDQVERLLGSEAREAAEQMRTLVRSLERAGYVERNGKRLELTPLAIRRIGQRVLEDIFGHLKRDQFGRHALRRGGSGGDRIDETKSYEFGDPFLLDLQGTVMNSLQRGAGLPLRLQAEDFSVHRTETLTRSATVLMLDMSRSMWLRGCFLAAKKVAVALDTLIRSRYPRDSLYVVGFSRYARELKPRTLHTLTWDEEDYGTNLQHGLMAARRLLAPHSGGNRQIILITDGEPTAHLEGGRAFFSYPPTLRTFQETLREVGRCTQERIVINTFMLERGGYLAEFVNRMTKINRGRAFFVQPERLGEYILVDYLEGKRRRVS